MYMKLIPTKKKGEDAYYRVRFSTDVYILAWTWILSMCGLSVYMWINW